MTLVDAGIFRPWRAREGELAGRCTLEMPCHVFGQLAIIQALSSTLILLSQHVCAVGDELRLVASPHVQHVNTDIGCSVWNVVQMVEDLPGQLGHILELFNPEERRRVFKAAVRQKSESHFVLNSMSGRSSAGVLDLAYASLAMLSTRQDSVNNSNGYSVRLGELLRSEPVACEQLDGCDLGLVQLVRDG